MSREAAESMGTTEFLESAHEGVVTIDYAVVYGGQDEGAKIAAFFKCCNCELRMSWVQDKRLFVCEDCDIVLSPREALFMSQRCGEAISALEEQCEARQVIPVAVKVEEKRGWLWRLLNWFGGPKESDL